ncbi:hypothetical protein [Serratia marcescens]|uniref:hypothetical protein n=1 Tax=Serratia marcescens TaxID=615 RepID=UPI00074550FA|nr:hypothetical protein [Serratia marcescens]CVE92637.1 Uncharacterised protein [Serratia marcescens]
MDKLSELSKPVAEIKCHEDLSLSIVNVRDGFSLGRHPVYSQEYVSALLAERDAFEASALALRDEWRARGECIAELEAKLARFGDVRQHYLAGYDDGHSRGLNAGRLYKEDTGMVMHRHASANAYAAEGDE